MAWDKWRDWLETAKEALAYYEGKTFDFWVGPMPDDLNDPKSEQVHKKIARVFHSSNIVRDIIDREAAALVAQFPHWYLEDEKGERLEENNDAEKALQQWLDWVVELYSSQEVREKKHPLLKAITHALTTEAGYLRLYEPAKFANSPDLHKRIGLHAPAVESVRFHRDDDEHILAIEYWYGKGYRELQYLLGDRPRLPEELKAQVLNPAAVEGSDPSLLVIETYKDLEFVPDRSFTSNTGGRYTIYEIRLDSLITPSLKETQNSINKALTMKSLNNDLGGFMERVVTAGLPPGDFVKDDTHPSGYRYQANKAGLEMGSGRTTFIQPLPIYDQEGAISGYSDPGIHWREPVSPEAFRQSLEIDVTFAYREAKQAHLLSAGDGSLAGVSREHIKQDWITGLENKAQPIQSIVKSILALALLRLSDLTGNDYRNFRPVVSIRLSTGKPLPEERKENREDFNAGLRSRTTAMAESGIDDPDAEVNLQRREKEDDIEFAKKEQDKREQLGLNPPPAPGADPNKPGGGEQPPAPPAPENAGAA